MALVVWFQTKLALLASSLTKTTTYLTKKKRANAELVGQLISKRASSALPPCEDHAKKASKQEKPQLTSPLQLTPSMTSPITATLRTHLAFNPSLSRRLLQMAQCSRSLFLRRLVASWFQFHRRHCFLLIRKFARLIRLLLPPASRAGLCCLQIFPMRVPSSGSVCRSASSNRC